MYEWSQIKIVWVRKDFLQIENLVIHIPLVATVFIQLFFFQIFMGLCIFYSGFSIRANFLYIFLIYYKIIYINTHT